MLLRQQAQIHLQLLRVARCVLGVVNVERVDLRMVDDLTARARQAVPELDVLRAPVTAEIRVEACDGFVGRPPQADVVAVEQKPGVVLVARLLLEMVHVHAFVVEPRKPPQHFGE